MEILKWFEIENVPGHYWDFEPGVDEPGIIEIVGQGLYMFAGNEQAYDFADSYATENHNFIRIVPTSLEDHWALHVFKQERRFELVNGDAEYPAGIEGFWREREDIGASEGMLPWPVLWEHKEFDKQEFINKLADVETHKATETNMRGKHFCRLSGIERGSYEYEYNGWTWPEGLIEYVRMGVLPSRAFYAFIMEVSEENCKYLPTYNRK